MTRGTGIAYTTWKDVGPTSVSGTPEAPPDHIALAGLIIGSLVNIGKKVSCHFEFKLSYNNGPNKFELLDGINNVLFFFVTGGFILGLILFIRKIRKNRARDQDAVAVSYRRSQNVDDDCVVAHL